MATDQELARRELERRQKEEADFFSRFANVPALEEVLAIGTGALAEPLSGLGALFAAPFVGSQRAAEMVGEFQEDLTYVPRGARANANLQAVGEILAPVGEAMDWAAENAGEGVYNLTGSPAAAAFTEGLIQAAPDIAGLRFGGRMIDNMGDVGGQATGMGRREKGIFVGEKAQGVDRDALERAKNLRAQGVDRDAIWNDELWAYSEPEGKWKTELDDRGADVIGHDYIGQMRDAALSGDMDLVRSLRGQSEGYVMPYRDPTEYGFTDVFSHPEAENAYDLSGVGYQVTDDMGIGEGAYDPSLDKIHLGQGANKDSARSTTLHELQHGIQAREGFAGGGNQEVGKAIVQDARYDLDQLNQKLQVQLNQAAENADKILKDPEKVAEVENHLKSRGLWEEGDSVDWVMAKFFIEDTDPTIQRMYQRKRQLENISKLTPYESYLRHAGEAESRNVQKRRDWTMDQRRQTPPWASLDVPEDELIYTTR